MQAGSRPFPQPFYFGDGQACSCFNELVLACENRWDESRAILADGIWSTFFGGMGRIDLAAAANQAARDPDLDRALSQLLEKIPADPDFLQPPKLALDKPEENLGKLIPGKDCSFDLVITNQGRLLLHGVVWSDCDWLAFGDRTGPSEKIFQTRHTYSVQVLVLGSKLRAGLKPLRGKIVIETNGGSLTLPVRAEVPIRPFPSGAHASDVLAGAKSPHDIAIKAKEHPNEAAILFELGAVKAWYQSNGWTYPIDGFNGSGRGAIQQYFEALGLTKPPQLKIDVTSLSLKGKVGECLSACVAIHTEEPKPVYAHAWSNAEWVRIGSIQYQRKKADIPIEIIVPPNAGETVQAQVTIEGNGKQRFVVPVSLIVKKSRDTKRSSVPGAAASPSAGSIASQHVAKAARKGSSDESSDGKKKRIAIAAAISGFAMLLLVFALVLVFTRGSQEPTVVVTPPAAAEFDASAAWSAYDEQMRRGEALLQQEQYNEAIAAFTEALKHWPSEGKAEGMLALARTGEANRQQFDQVAAEAVSALKLKNIKLASDKVAFCAQLRPRDARLLGLRSQLKELQDGAAFEIASIQGRAALALGDLDKAREQFLAARDRRQNDPTTIAMLDAIDVAQKVQIYVRKTREAVQEKKYDEALVQVTSARNSLRGEVPAPGDKDLDALRQKAADLSVDAVWELIEAAHDSGQRHKQEAAAASAKEDYAIAAEQYRLALRDLAAAKSAFKETQASPKKFPATNVQVKEMDVEQLVRDWQIALDKATAYAHWKRGKDSLKASQNLLAQDKKENQDLLLAQATLAEAVKSFLAMNKVPDLDPKTELQAAQSELTKVARMLHPVNLDFQVQALPEDWNTAPKDFVFVPLGGKFWLRAGRSKKLDSPKTLFPRDFECEITLAMVNKAGTLDNQWLSTSTNPFIIALHAKSGDDFVLALGEDLTYKLERRSRAAFDNKNIDIQKLIATSMNAPLSVHMLRQGAMATLELFSLGANQKERRRWEVPMAQEFDHMSVTLTEPPGGVAYPALLKVSLKAYLKDKAN